MNLHDLEYIKPIMLEFDDFWSVNILDQNFNNPNSIYFIAKAESGDDFSSQNSQESDNILGVVALFVMVALIKKGWKPSQLILLIFAIALVGALIHIF